MTTSSRRATYKAPWAHAPFGDGFRPGPWWTATGVALTDVVNCNGRSDHPAHSELLI